MSIFTIIVILYIIFYILLAVLNIVNQRKRREKLLKEEQLEKKELEGGEKVSPPLIEVKEKEVKGKFESEEGESLVLIPEEEKIIEKIIPSELVEAPIKEKILEPQIKEVDIQKVPKKIKKLISFSKNEIIKGIIFKEILTQKFKK